MQLRDFVAVPSNWLWTVPPITCGVLGSAVVSRYVGSALSVSGLLVGIGLGLAVWLVYATLTTVPAILRGSRLSGALRKDSLTFLPVAAALLLALACMSLPTTQEEGHVAGSLTALAVALLVLSLVMKVYFLDADLWWTQRLLSGRRAVLCLALIVLLGTAAIAVAAVWRHGQFLTYTFDLGTMDQTVWNTAHGRILQYTIGMTELTSRPLTGRLEVPFLFIAPLYRLWPDPRLLQIAQAIMLCLAAVPLYCLARRRLRTSPAAVVVAACFVLQPALQGIGLAAVHTNAFALPFLLAAFLCLDQDRPRAFWVWCVAALCCREDIALVTGPLGVYAAFRPSFRRTGLGVCLVSVLWLVVLIGIIPALHGPAPALAGPRNMEMAGLLAKGYGGMVRALVAQPSLLVTELFRAPNALYAARLLVPLALLPLVSPALLLVALPGMYLNMISGWSEMNVIHSQYQAYVLPTLAVAGLYGAARVRDSLDRWSEESRWAQDNQVRPRNALPALCLLALCCAIYGRASFGKRTFAAPLWSPEHTKALHRAVERIPPDASVTATQHVGPHLTQRERLFTSYREGLGEYVVCDAYESIHWTAMKARRDEIAIHRRYPAEVIGRKDYELLSEEQGVVILKRGSTDRTPAADLFVRPAGKSSRRLATVNGWELAVARTHPVAKGRRWIVDVTLVWHPGLDADLRDLRLLCVSGPGRRELPYTPAQGLVTAADVPAGSALVDRFFVTVGIDLGPSLALSLVDGEVRVSVAEVSLPAAEHRSLPSSVR